MNFKTKKRRNLQLEQIAREAIERSTGEIKDNVHLLPPGPNCLSEKDLIDHIKWAVQHDHPEMYENFRKNRTHIHSCKRCHSLRFKVSEKLAEKPFSELL